jgi:putative acetyltransferase
MQIRRFKPGEEAELWHLFHDSVRHIDTSLYTSAQLHAWSPDEVDMVKWRARIRNISPFVVEHEKRLIGFADVQTTGYVDHFYVHHLWQRRRVGTLLMQILQEVARQDAIDKLFADVSIAAKPFFASWGFDVEREQLVHIDKEVLKSYRMSKPLRVSASRAGASSEMRI